MRDPLLSTPVALTEAEVHVWLADLDVEPALARTLSEHLSPPEKQRAARFIRPRDQTRFAAGRGILRVLLSGYLESAPSEIELAFTSLGKPFLADTAASGHLRFNVSHSHGLALFGFARRRDIGIDLELVRPEVATERLAERFFAPAEAARLRGLPPTARVAAFFECWTRKEAYLKARGDGLWRALDSFEVAFGPGVKPAILKAADAGESEKWTMTDLQPAPGYAGALVVEGPPENVKQWRWAGPSHG